LYYIVYLISIENMYLNSRRLQT